MAKSPKCLGFSSANNDRAPTVLKSDFIKRTADDASDCDSDGDYYPILHTDSEDDDDVYHCDSGDEDEQPLPSARSKEKSPWVSASSSSQAKAAISCPCVPVEF